MYTEEQLLQRSLMERQNFEDLYDGWERENHPVLTREQWVRVCEGAPTRLIVSRPENTGDRRLPALIHFHGGGYIRGRADYDELYCREIVHHVGCVTVNVNYRMAPEHRFPVQPEECFAVVRYVMEHAEEFGVDAARVAVGGHSAGGNLATVVCLMALEAGAPLPCCQVLDYPPVLLDAATPFAGFEPGLELPPERRSAFFNVSYLEDLAQARDWRVSPLLAPSLAGSPPALIVTAGMDPLRPDTERYAERLREAGCPVEYRCYDRCNHGFTVMPGLGPEEDARDAWETIYRYLRKQLFRS